MGTGVYGCQSDLIGMKKIIELFLVIASFSSCTVLEDRGECPCYLNFAHKGFNPGSYEGTMEVVVFGEKLVSDGVHSVSRLKDGTDEIPVPKGIVRMGGIGGLSSGRVLDSLMVIPAGSDCDPIYAFSSTAEAFGEVAYVCGTIRKNHSVIRIVMENSSGDVYPFSVRLRSNVSGMNLLTLEPVEGLFSHNASKEAEGVFSMRLPRQKDDSLVLEILKADGSEEKIDELPLGTYLVDGLGYDWTALDLADINVYINYSRSIISVNVSDWGPGGVFEFEI